MTRYAERFYLPKVRIMKRVLRLSLLTALVGICAPFAKAYPIVGTVPLPDGARVLPGDVTGSAFGSLLASKTDPWSVTTTAGAADGTLTTAVFREASGTLDFYYQIANNSNSTTSITAGSARSFSGLTSVGYRSDGSALGFGFVNGTQSPDLAGRSSVNIEFSAQTAGITPGETSMAYVISTNATQFGWSANFEVIDGGYLTVVSAFQPAAATPEPSSLMLLGSGILGLGVVIRRKLTT